MCVGCDVMVIVIVFELCLSGLIVYVGLLFGE